MFLRKLGKRGVAMTEYAVLLAFVAAIGGSFASDNGLGQSIINAVTGAKTAITDAGSGKLTSRQPMKSNGITIVQHTALEMQTGIMYDFLSNPENLNRFFSVDLKNQLGQNYELAAASLNMNGGLNGLWYKTQDGQLVKISDSNLLSSMNGTAKNQAGTLWNAYETNWNSKGSDPSIGDAASYCAFNASDSGDAKGMRSMFVAYDSYGNITQKVDTTGLTIAAGDNVADRTTSMYMCDSKNGYHGGYAYSYDNTKGFYYTE